MITLEMAQKLKDAGAMGMGISLDSMDKEKHNQFRKFPGAWEGAVQGMRNCRAVGLPFQIHTTVMEWNNHELEALTDFAVAEGAVAHHFFSWCLRDEPKPLKQSPCGQRPMRKL